MLKKMLVLLAVSVFTIGVIAGCGQQTPTVSTSTPKPDGLSIRGTVYTYNLDGSRGSAVVGAHVRLSGAGADVSSSAVDFTYTATTDANGEYVIKDVPDGDYQVIVTAEGYQRDSDTTAIIKPSSSIPADGTIQVEDILISSDPIILSYSPTPNSVVTATGAFTVAFNEAMDTSTVVPTITPSSVRTLVTDGGNVGLTVSWSTDEATMTVTPKNALISNEVYTLTVNTTAKDAAGYSLSTSGEQALSRTQTYRVSTGTGLPGAALNLSISYTGPTTECDYTRVKSSNTVYLNWDSPTSGGPITGYKLYVAYGATGNYHYVSTYSNNQASLSVGSNILDALYNISSLDPICVGGYPFVNGVCRFKVVAYNGDGEAVSGATLDAHDTLGPAIAQAEDKTGWSDGKLNNNYFLPKCATTEAYVGYNEPLSAIGAASLFHVGTYEATAAEIVTSYNGTLSGATWNGSYTIVKLTVTEAGAVDTVSAEAGAATDLYGNPSLADSGTTL